VLPAGRRPERRCAADHAVHDDIPDNVAAHLTRRSATRTRAIAGRPHRLSSGLDIERSASTPLETRGVYARWDADDQRLRVYSSTQTPTSVRAAIATCLELPFAQVECIAPDVGGGFGVKIMHPWPRSCWCPWAARSSATTSSSPRTAASTSSPPTTNAARSTTIEVGFDDDGRILGLDVRFLHDHGAYIPYGLIVPIITSTQLLGPYRIEHYRVDVPQRCTPTRCRSRPTAGGPAAGLLRDGAHDRRIARDLGKDRTEVRAATSSSPTRCPTTSG
jgi:aerobic carbon-monoxide dehydrogenase large subunit